MTWFRVDDTLAMHPKVYAAGNAAMGLWVRAGAWSMQQLTDGDRSRPIVAVGFNSERYQGRNLALRLVALGYTDVSWYRGGREAWQVAGLPDADLVLQDW